MALFDIFVFLMVLGVLITVHELGHFIAAKMCGIYVDRFSVGMPPRILGFKWGETDYCLGLLPLGGYVKMAGQEDAPLSDEERDQTYGHVPPERWFNNKPVWQRAFVLIAGPAMNLILGFFVYAYLVAVGGDVPLFENDNRVGRIEENSPASEADLYVVDGPKSSVDVSAPADARGLKTGDRILTVDGTTVTGIMKDVAIAAVLNEGRAIRLEIERTSAEGIATRYVSFVAPKVLDDSELSRFGIAPYDTALIEHTLPGSPAEAVGLQAGDEVIRANGNPIDKHTLTELLRAMPEGETIGIEVERDGRILPLEVSTRISGRIEGLSFRRAVNPLIFLSGDTQPVITRDDAQYTRDTKLKTGDVITELDNQPCTGTTLRTFYDRAAEDNISITVERPARGFGMLQSAESLEITLTVAQLIEGVIGYPEDEPYVVYGISAERQEESGIQAKDKLVAIDGQPATATLLRELEETRIGETIPVTVERPAIFFGLYQKEETLEASLNVDSIHTIGVVFGNKTEFRKASAGEVIPAAYAECKRVVTQIGTILGRLVTGGLSPKLLGGPVMIYNVTTSAAHGGLAKLLETMAAISINLCLFNLLPLPVLDGGQLVVCAIEGIRRKPVNIKILETVQQVGFLFIIGLMLYVTFNDVSRVLTNFLP